MPVCVCGQQPKLLLYCTANCAAKVLIVSRMDLEQIHNSALGEVHEENKEEKSLFFSVS